MCFETRIHPLSFISHFQKCSLRLKSILWVSYPMFKNVLWDSNPSFEFHIPFFKMFFETQIHSFSFISIFHNDAWELNASFQMLLGTNTMSDGETSLLTPKSVKQMCDLRFEIWDLRFLTLEALKIFKFCHMWAPLSHMNNLMSRSWTATTKNYKLLKKEISVQTTFQRSIAQGTISNPEYQDHGNYVGKMLMSIGNVYIKMSFLAKWKREQMLAD